MKIAGTRLPLWLTIGYILALLPVLAWPCIAPMAAFAFDSPGSTQNPGAYVMAASVVLYPLIPLVAVPISFFIYRGGHKPPSYILAGIGLLPFIAILLLLVAVPLAGLLSGLGVKF
jgi:hypothetical protein